MDYRLISEVYFSIYLNFSPVILNMFNLYFSFSQLFYLLYQVPCCSSSDYTYINFTVVYFYPFNLVFLSFLINNV